MILFSPARLPEKNILISDSQRRRLESEGKFPKRVQVTARSHAYVESEIDEYIARRIAARELVAA